VTLCVSIQLRFAFLGYTHVYILKTHTHTHTHTHTEARFSNFEMANCRCLFARRCTSLCDVATAANVTLSDQYNRNGVGRIGVGDTLQTFYVARLFGIFTIQLAYVA
jgi:hypothetical protein